MAVMVGIKGTRMMMVFFGSRMADPKNADDGYGLNS